MDALSAVDDFIQGIPEEPSGIGIDEWNAFLSGPWTRLDGFAYEEAEAASKKYLQSQDGISVFRADVLKFFFQSKGVYLSWYLSGQVWREVELAKQHNKETGRPDSGLEYHAMTSLNEGGFGIHHHKIQPREFLEEGLDDPDEDYRRHCSHVLGHMDSVPGEKVVGITYDDVSSRFHGFQFEVWLMETRG